MIRMLRPEGTSCLLSILQVALVSFILLVALATYKSGMSFVEHPRPSASREVAEQRNDADVLQDRERGGHVERRPLQPNVPATPIATLQVLENDVLRNTPQETANTESAARLCTS